MSGLLSRRVIASAFARSFLIQGSWNYHSMIGSGFAFAMMPGLRRIFGRDTPALDAAIRRHLEHFNAHPYLSTVALGAVLRLEADGESAETVRRFKAALRGPLGSLGDRLVWATWLPTVSVAALGLLWLGLPPWAVVTCYLVGYNAVHLGLRAWGLKAGLREGLGVGQSLGRANFDGWTARLQRAGAVFLGVLAGAVLSAEGGLASSGVAWVALAGAGFVAGLWIGQRAWRPTAAVVVATVGVVAAVGIIR